MRWTATILGTLLLLTACVSGGSPENTASGNGEVTPSASEGVARPPSPLVTTGPFEGTPEEWSALVMGCLREAGWSVDEGQAPGELEIDTTGRTDEEFIAAQESCHDEVGRPQVEGLSNEQLQERYETRLAQFGCLAEHGWLQGEPISFEVFVEQYERSGQQRLWLPAREATAPTDGPQGASDVCPLDGW